jgi:hypothetical protein
VAHRRSLHYATPDFLLILAALMHFMRPSLRKGAHAAMSSAAWQEIRVRPGRDDNSSWKLHLAFPNKIVIPSEAEGSAVRHSGFPNSEVLTQTLFPGMLFRGCSFEGAGLQPRHQNSTKKSGFSR